MATTNTAQSVFTVTIAGSAKTVIMNNDDIENIYFIEDIFSYLKTGCMSCRDTRGLVEFLPIVGNETLTIEYGTTDGGNAYIVKKFTFDIIKVAEVESTQDKWRRLMKIFFIEAPHKRLHMERYSKSYKCDFHTNYVADILEFHAGMPPGMFLNFEPCNEILQYFYTGLKTPAQCIEWLLSRCSGMGSGQPGYLLYSSTQNEAAPYNLVTLETMLQQRSQMPPYAGYYTIGTQNQYNINRVIKYSDGRVDKKSLDMMMNYIGIGFDIKRKTYHRIKYTYKDALARFTCLGDYSLFEEGKDSLMSSTQGLTGEFDDLATMPNLYFGDWIKRYCLQHTVTFLLEGHVERYCGGVIEVMWPSSNDDEIFDKNMNGVFLVKSITHSFTPRIKPIYTQKMVLIKNGYNNSDGALTMALKPNTKIVVESVSPYSPYTNPGVRGL